MQGGPCPALEQTRYSWKVPAAARWKQNWNVVFDLSLSCCLPVSCLLAEAWVKTDAQMDMKENKIDL